VRDVQLQEMMYSKISCLMNTIITKFLHAIFLSGPSN